MGNKDYTIIAADEEAYLFSSVKAKTDHMLPAIVFDRETEEQIPGPPIAIHRFLKFRPYIDTPEKAGIKNVDEITARLYKKVPAEVLLKLNEIDPVMIPPVAPDYSRG